MVRNYWFGRSGDTKSRRFLSIIDAKKTAESWQCVKIT